MNTSPVYKTLPLAQIVHPPYNPRVTIEKGSDEYKRLVRSLDDHGLVEPLVVNLHNMHCIGGNQRLDVLRDLGVTEVLCSVIDQPDMLEEKKLCLALNKIGGRWEQGKLEALLSDDAVLQYETGFYDDEIEALTADAPDIDDEPEPEEPDIPDADDEEDDDLGLDDAADDDADAAIEDAATATVVIGHLTFRVSYDSYNDLIGDIRDAGIFAKKDICAELKRRLLKDD